MRQIEHDPETKHMAQQVILGALRAMMNGEQEDRQVPNYPMGSIEEAVLAVRKHRRLVTDDSPEFIDAMNQLSRSDLFASLREQ